MLCAYVNGEEAGGAGEWAARGAGEGDIRGVQLAGGCKQLTLWVYATLGRKPGEQVMGQLDGGDIRGVQVVGDLKVVIMISLPSLFGCGL